MRSPRSTPDPDAGPFWLNYAYGEGVRAGVLGASYQRELLEQSRPRNDSARYALLSQYRQGVEDGRVLKVISRSR